MLVCSRRIICNFKIVAAVLPKTKMMWPRNLVAYLPHWHYAYTHVCSLLIDYSRLYHIDLIFLHEGGNYGNCLFHGELNSLINSVYTIVSLAAQGCVLPRCIKLIFYFDIIIIFCRANNRHAGDLRRYCALYDATVIISRWKVPTTITLSLSRNDRNCKYIFMFLQITPYDIRLSREKLKE